MKALIEAAQPLSVTCHRAFDMTRNPEEALEALIRCGVHRVLTSGQRATAVEAIPLFKKLNEQAAAASSSWPAASSVRTTLRR